MSQCARDVLSISDVECISCNHHVFVDASNAIDLSFVIFLFRYLIHYSAHSTIFMQSVRFDHISGAIVFIVFLSAFYFIMFGFMISCKFVL